MILFNMGCDEEERRGKNYQYYFLVQKNKMGWIEELKNVNPAQT